MSAFSPITRIAGLLAVAAALTGLPARSQSAFGYPDDSDAVEAELKKRVTSPSSDERSLKIDVKPFSSPTPNPAATSDTSQPPKPPEEIDLKADRQSFDARRGVFVAEGNVRAQLRGGVLQADRIEFDNNFNTLFARGSVRLRRGSQYFQASTFRYSLIQNSGELEDVYGVIELDELSEGFGPSSTVDPSSSTTNSERQLPVVESTGLGFPTALDLEIRSTTAERVSLGDDGINFWNAETVPLNTWTVPVPSQGSNQAQKPVEGMACPVALPPIPDWHPHPWAVTAWGGQMIDAPFGDTFLFNGRLREEYLLGVSMQKRIWRAGPFSLELEADLFGHQAFRQQGGEFNQNVPNADTPEQFFGEAVIGLGARLWVQPWLSFGFVEGLSYNTSVSNYERTYRENFSQLLNYLAFELEASVSDQLSMVGRIHHRSGAFGTYNGVKEGSNAYLLGLRYRWGKDLSLIHI